MAKLCPSCGATPVAGARFCRVCGTPLAKPGEPVDGDGGGVSPGARTIPLTNEARTTRGMAADDPHAPVTNTSKVKRAEMDDLLRRPRRESSGGLNAGADGSIAAHDDIHRSAPPTNELTLPSENLSETTQIAPVAPTPPSKQTRPVVRPRRSWPYIILGLLLMAGLVVGLRLLLSSRRSEPPVSSNTGNSPAPAPADQKRLVEEQLAEAEALLASGQTGEAIARLRSAIELDPANPVAHLRLGEALEKSGERQAAMDEYRLATRNDQNNADAWRALASAQLAEGLFNDAAESYRRYIALKAETEVDDNVWLDYAQALVLGGQTDAARDIYQRLASSTSPDTATRAKRMLAQLPSLASPNVNANAQASPRDPRVDPAENTNAQASLTPQPAPTTPAQPTPQPTAQPAPTASTPSNENGAPVTSADAYYDRGLSIIRGRDLKSLPRAELLQALEYFQRAQSGTRRIEATRYIQQLGREYDRRKRQALP
ncbi:MAG: tetratricopeptide repeat protein [Pyrinomonadaceae bacterium]